VVVMHMKGQLLTSTVASRTSWIRSPHLSEKLKNPFKLKNGCLLRLTEGLKAEYAAHQLQGPVGIWWNQYREALPADTVLDWNLFHEAFKGHFIPPSVMEMKHTEFM